jgi:predicted AlkP superfamily phosphohydrolase/phosphomutase
MIFVLGIDAATWTVIKPNLCRLPWFKRLCEIGICRDLVLREKPISPSVWCSMFSGKLPEEHKHDSYVVSDNIVKRKDIKVDFIWDILQRERKKVMALNVPFIVPPYSFNVDFKPVGFGLPTNDREWHEELQRVTEKTKELLLSVPDLLISVYTLLDRIQHYHWGEPVIVDWYSRLDEKIGEIVFDSGFLENPKNCLIVVSDHGFCSFGEAKIQTLPEKTEHGTLKGDHHENALLITVNIDYEINKPQDIFHAIRQQLR